MVVMKHPSNDKGVYETMTEDIPRYTFFNGNVLQKLTWSYLMMTIEKKVVDTGTYDQ